MKFNVISVILSLTLISFIYSSCSKDETQAPDPTAGMTKIAEGYATGAATKVEIFSQEKTIYSGFQKFYMALSDSATGNRLEESKITVVPMMDMGTMKHTAPVENPASEKALNQLFPVNVVFIMSSLGGNWTLNVDISNRSKQGSMTVPVTVTEPARTKVKSFSNGSDGQKYFFALVEPSAPKIGINELEIAVYKRASMMSFPADSSMNIIFTPEMPTMNHGSPNNVNPVHNRLGHYKGKANFTMTGLWRLNLDFMNGAAVADSTQYIDIEF
jgi:YtkA-like